MKTYSLPQYAAAFVAAVFAILQVQAHQAPAMRAGEMLAQIQPDRPSYAWLQAHEDNALPAEYREVDHA